MQEFIKKMWTVTYGSGTTLIILNKEMEDIMKMVKSLKDSGLSIKRVTKIIENKKRVSKELDFLVCY